MGIEISKIDDICFISDKNTIKTLLSPIEYRKLMGELKAMRIYVYNNEGENIPHFHISKIDKSDCCLKIMSAEWFTHGKNKSILSKKELKLLYEWLNMDNKKEWKNIIIEWNKQRAKHVDLNLEIPAYYTL